MAQPNPRVPKVESATYEATPRTDGLNQSARGLRAAHGLPVTCASDKPAGAIEGDLAGGIELPHAFEIGWEVFRLAKGTAPRGEASVPREVAKHLAGGPIAALLAAEVEAFEPARRMPGEAFDGLAGDR